MVDNLETDFILNLLRDFIRETILVLKRFDKLDDVNEFVDLVFKLLLQNQSVINRNIELKMLKKGSKRV